MKDEEQGTRDNRKRSKEQDERHGTGDKRDTGL